MLNLSTSFQLAVETKRKIQNNDIQLSNDISAQSTVVSQDYENQGFHERFEISKSEYAKLLADSVDLIRKNELIKVLKDVIHKKRVRTNVCMVNCAITNAYAEKTNKIKTFHANQKIYRLQRKRAT